MLHFKLHFAEPGFFQLQLSRISKHPGRGRPSFASAGLGRWHWSWVVGVPAARGAWVIHLHGLRVKDGKTNVIAH